MVTARTTGALVLVAALAVGCASDEPSPETASAPPAGPETEEGTPGDVSEADPEPDGSSGGLSRGGGSSGSSIERGGGVEAPPLDVRTRELFGDLDAGQRSEGAIVEVEGDVLFDFDEDQIRSAADDLLDDLAELAAGTGDVPIRVVGHTDGVGSDDYNLDLSQRRAESVVAGLVDRGVPSDRLTADGVGSDEPVATEGGDDDEAARARNRRVEVTFEGVDLDG